MSKTDTKKTSDASSAADSRVGSSDSSALRALADHLAKVTEGVRSHGGHGWTYDDEIKALNRTADELESILADVNDACITLADCIEESEGFDDPRTANKLHEVRAVLLSYLPNIAVSQPGQPLPPT